ncbi:J domain-containing protein [Nocardioides sp. R1-1]|uniref:J domain-containing protein n=1 Tax=Nocardioides sp. R1-1 TaxID=3383502 RepID=UPI0038D23B3F
MSLYDLLDVEETASADEIRAAWKAAIADLDPTERRFRAYNDAAGVLLDPDKRAAYDAELAAERAAEASADDASDPDLGTTDEPGRENSRLDDEASSSQREFHRPAGETVSTPAPQPRRAPGTPAIVAAALAAVLCVAVAVVLTTLPGARGEATAKELAERGERVEAAAISAEGAAEQMVAPVLSYGYETMAADLERRGQHMTDDFRAKTERGWPEITKEAEAQQIVVEAKPTGAALTRVDPDGRRAAVVVFIDQYVTKAGAEPFVLRMWATFSLVKVDGSESRWLLDDLCTDDSCDLPSSS